MRQCNQCDFVAKAGTPQEEMQIFSDHHATHNPSPAQWTGAYNELQRLKALRKKSGD